MKPVGDTMGLLAGGVVPGSAGSRVEPAAMLIGWLRGAVAAPIIGVKMVCGP